ncbi:hypothetical protein V2J09_005824 [Rumex salicifolius]
MHLGMKIQMGVNRTGRVRQNGFRYNPYGPGWGNIVWAHSTSTDLVNWTPQPIALTPTIPSEDENGCWSGSTTILPGKGPAIIYTGGDFQGKQYQIIAFPDDPSDPFLRNWHKHPQNPILAGTDENRIDPKEFRDPTTAWMMPDGRWRMSVGSKVGDRGVSLMFTSQDFIKWDVNERPLYYLDGTGMWECPDFFPVNVGKNEGVETSVLGSDVRHVFKVSVVPTQHDCYTIGTYDTANDVFVPDEDLSLVNSASGLRYDYGRFYASKSFYDEDKKRRVLWAWIAESCSKEDDNIKGWSGIQGFPRTILLDESGKELVQWPIKEIEMLRGRQVDLPSRILNGGSKFEVLDITAAQADVEISFGISDFSKAEKFDPSWTDAHSLCNEKGASVEGSIGPFGLLIMASKGLEESSLNPTTEKKRYGTFMKVDPLHEDISLRTLIDHSIIESFGNKGKNCITSRVYPTLAINDDAHLYVFNYGSETIEMKRFRAWNMEEARVA